MSNAYEGGQCHVPFTEGKPGYQLAKPNYNLKFFNNEQEEVAQMDFNGPGLAFEGIADEAAMIFIEAVAKAFKGRLEEEYQRGFNDGKKAK